jgi:hypothetical protein
MLLAFDGGILRVGFFGFGSTLIDAHTLPGQTEGLKGCVRYGRIGGRRVKVKTKVFIKPLALGGSVGF